MPPKGEAPALAINIAASTAGPSGRSECDTSDCNGEQGERGRLGHGAEGQVDLVALGGDAEVAAAEVVGEGGRIDGELGRVEAAYAVAAGGD